MDSITISPQIQAIETDLQKLFYQASRVEEEHLRQKSRSMWLESGDKNSSYFHKQAEARKNYKVVTEINYQGSLVKKFDDIKKAAFNTFKDLFTAPDADPLNPLDHPFELIPNLVQDADNLFLTAPISMKELKTSLFE